VQVGNQDVTAAQAIIHVHTDQRGFCTYRLSEGSAFRELLDDVNPNLFAGANSDARPGSIINGADSSSFSPSNNATDHTFVAGTRTAAKAAMENFIRAPCRPIPCIGPASPVARMPKFPRFSGL